MRNRRHGDPLAGRTPVGDPSAFLDAAILADTAECIIWPYAYSGGIDGGPRYPRIGVTGTHVPEAVTRIVCDRVYGPPPPGDIEAAHSCRQTMCINKRHLRWATVKENTEDRRIHGTMPIGEAHVNSTINVEIVRKIRHLRATLNYGPNRIATALGIGQGAASGVIYGKTWRDVA
jgi:hypothetical protein